ncbi:MAG TPA: MFS transporter [Methanoregulaceae archaeon]|nr:MFS transporter [Methanoregulaceae archaeon]
MTRSFRDYPLVPYNAFYAVRHCGGQMNQGSVQRKSGFSFIIRAFKYRNYVLFFSGQGISIIGTWMQQIAMTWLVYRMTNSTLLLGVISFTGMIPIFFLSSFAGVSADRRNRYRIVVTTQFLAMGQAFIAAFLTLTGIITVWQIIALSSFLGMVNAFEMPARQSLVIEIVENKEDLGNAIALNSFMFNGGRLIGPSIAGVLISLFGEGTCFLINGFSFLAIILALLAMNIPARKRAAAGIRILKGLVEGYGYAFRTAPIRAILIHLGIISFLSMPYTVLMPYFARDYLHGGPDTLGLLMASSGCGALLGTLFLASRSTIQGLGRVIVVTSLIFGAGIIAFAFSRIITVSMALLFFTGFGLIVQWASSNTILQMIVKEDMRGRVMSLFAMAFAGMAPFGSLLGGALSSRIGPQATLAVCGIACIIEALAFIPRTSILEEALGGLKRK